MTKYSVDNMNKSLGKDIKTVLVTGSNGMLGKAICNKFISDASLINQETDNQTLDSHHRALDYWTNKHNNFSIDEFMRF